MIRGRAAERAVGLAAVHYLRASRANIKKQATGMRNIGGRWIHTTRAPIDFRGTIAGGKSWCGEVKEDEGSNFPILDASKLSYKQREELDRETKLGSECWLIIDLPAQLETYAVAWPEVQRFLAAPYRASLSLQWLRAHGMLCKVTNRGRDNFAIWFLDLVPHDEREMAYLAEAAERAKSPLIELDARKPVEQVTSVRPNKNTDPEDYRRHIMNLAEQGIAHVMGSKPKTFGRRGRG